MIGAPEILLLLVLFITFGLPLLAVILVIWLVRRSKRKTAEQSMSTPYQAAPIAPNGVAAQRGWWSRNWKWFVPTLILLFALLITGFVFGVLALVFGSMKMSEPYKYAMDQAQHSPVVVQRLGQPVDSGMFISGQINVSGPAGHADLAIPISGPRGKATVYVVGDKSAGKWGYQTLQVEFENDPNRVDLLTEPAPGSNR